MARAADERLVRVLTEEQLIEGLAAGAVRSGGREVAAEVDPDSTVHTALEAQRDGLFQAMVDDAPAVPCASSRSAPNGGAASSYPSPTTTPGAPRSSRRS